MADSNLDRYRKRKAALDREATSWTSHWRDLSDFILPRRGRFLVTDRNKGDKRNSRIVDNTATFAARTLASGMMAGITSPARPWFRLTTPDLEMMEFGPVKEWLFQVESRMRTVMAQSNFYNTLHNVYAEQGTFGTAPMVIEEDFNDVIRCTHFTVGSYRLATNEYGRVDSMYRDVPMTVGQLVSKFGKENVSSVARNLYTSNNTEAWIDVIHLIEPRKDYNLDARDNKNMPITSVWYEAKNDNRDARILRESGFQENLLLAPRWLVTGSDVYGSSPGMDALGDIKALQIEQKRKAQGIDKMVNPPLVGPATLENKHASVLPGNITYIDTAVGGQKLEPIYTVTPRVAELGEDIRETQLRIKRTFFEDLFLMLAQSDRRQITAREVDERHEEKLLMLGPTLERENDELLDPAIDRIYSIMDRNGLLPPAPDELDGIELKVQYISILAQAQKAVGITSVDKLIGYVGNIAQAQPEVLDKIDFDQSVDEYGEMLGVSPRIIRSDDEVDEIRAGRAKQQQAQAAAQAAASAADISKTASEVNTQDKNALTDILGGMGQ